jgi:hypothetical protein
MVSALRDVKHHASPNDLRRSAQSKGSTAHRLKDALHARAAWATWAKDLPWVHLELRAQPREDIVFSPAEAVSGTPIVLRNEFLHGEEFSVDNISRIF